VDVVNRDSLKPYVKPAGDHDAIYACLKARAGGLLDIEPILKLANPIRCWSINLWIPQRSLGQAALKVGNPGFNLPVRRPAPAG
jgi:hypothetical protein